MANSELLFDDPSNSENEDDNAKINFVINMIGSKYLSGKYVAKYETTFIGEVMKVGNFYKVNISEVKDPYKFWFQLENEHSILVSELEEQLERSYDCSNSGEPIKITHMHKGYACAALYKNTWRRGQIQRQPQDGMVNIFFVDYGMTSDVDTDNIRYLDDSFAYAPRLCYRGTLDFVKPLGYRWTIESTSHFISLIQNRKWCAGVSEIDHKNNSVRLYLACRETNINFDLVNDGYAYPDDPRDRYQPHMAEVETTFDELETGECVRQQDSDVRRNSIMNGFDSFQPRHTFHENVLKLVEDFHKKEEAKNAAKKKDATIFLKIFGRILKNPFLNGTMSQKIDIVEATKGGNPFSGLINIS